MNRIIKAPSWLKSFYLTFVALLIPVYWHHYGPVNFLWLSDIALFFTMFGVLFSSPLFVSMVAVGILPLEIVWNIDFIGDVLTYFKFVNFNLIDLSDYMMDGKLPLYLRGFSLFHVFVPVVCIYYLIKWGYDKRALPIFTFIYWVDIILVYYFQPTENINWVFMPRDLGWTWISPFGWLILLLICVPIVFFIPMHFLLKKILRSVS